jgi:DNA polymerase III subunit gamma/tau
VRSVDRAIKKKTIDEAVTTLSLLPIFSAIDPIEVFIKNATPSQPVINVPEPKTPPANRLTDADRRTRQLHKENLSTPSISGMMNGLSGVSEPDLPTFKNQAEPKDQPFDSDQLTLAWKAFAEKVDAAQLKSALSVREPILLENFHVEYNLDNEVQRKRIVLDVKPKLLAYLHQALHNELIMVDFNVTENLQEIINKPYTDQEKYNSLVAKYPVLGIMKQRFGLDFE